MLFLVTVFFLSSCSQDIHYEKIKNKIETCEEIVLIDSKLNPDNVLQKIYSYDIGCNEESYVLTLTVQLVVPYPGGHAPYALNSELTSQEDAITMSRCKSDQLYKLIRKKLKS